MRSVLKAFFYIRYGIDGYITAKWDAMQRYLHCCGGNNYRIGYNDYRTTPIGGNFSVPDSCCFEPTPGCGYHIFHKSDVQIANIIFVHGCLTLLKDQVFSQKILTNEPQNSYFHEKKLDISSGI